MLDGELEGFCGVDGHDESGEEGHVWVVEEVGGEPGEHHLGAHEAEVGSGLGDGVVVLGQEGERF